MEITKDMLVSDILEKNPSIAEVLTRMGMNCISCMAASGESLEQAMSVHGYSPEVVDETVAGLNEFIKSLNP